MTVDCRWGWGFRTVIQRILAMILDPPMHPVIQGSTLETSPVTGSEKDSVTGSAMGWIPGRESKTLRSRSRSRCRCRPSTERFAARSAGGRRRLGATRDCGDATEGKGGSQACRSERKYAHAL